MTAQQTPRFEVVQGKGSEAVAKVKQLVHEGNVRRIRVRHDGHIIAEFPLTAAVVGAVFAPMLAALGALAALLTDCTIEIERTGDPTPPA